MDNEIYDVVESLNEAMYAAGEEDGYFAVVDSTYVQTIIYNELAIWNSDNDDRETDEEGNYTETIFEYCIRSLIDKAHQILVICQKAKSME